MLEPILINENDKIEVGNSIRKRRKELGYSQDELADLVNTSRVQIARHENAECEMSISSLFQYAQALKTSLLSLCPSRFNNKDSNAELENLISIIIQLSKEDQETIYLLAERLKNTRPKMQQI